MCRVFHGVDNQFVECYMYKTNLIKTSKNAKLSIGKIDKSTLTLSCKTRDVFMNEVSVSSGRSKKNNSVDAGKNSLKT